MKVKEICKSAIVAAVYVVLCMVNPVSFGPLQFRVANILVAIPLTKKNYAPAILIGIALANAFSPLGLIDVVCGVCAEGLAYILCVYGPLKNIPFAAKAAVTAVCVSLIIGGELTALYNASFWVSFVCLMITTFLCVMIGGILIKNTALKKIL